MTALRKFLFLARNDVLRASAVPMVARCPSFGAGANVAALRLYSLPRGVRQR
jgi:hypothetical protein